MADSIPTPATSNAIPTFSCFQKTVTLYDWWLVISQNDFQGNRLAISGVSSRKEEAVRLFNSAPIIKRFDEFSLETADGIYVVLRGFINEQRTLENGFTSQIFKSFYFGFPQNWESCALGCFREEAEACADSVNVVMDNVPVDFDEISADGKKKNIPTSLILPEEATKNCKTPFLGDECKVPKGTISGLGAACGSGGKRRSTRLHNINACQRKKQKQQHASRSPLKCPDEVPISTLTAMENCNTDTAVPDNVSANLPEIFFDAPDNFFPTSLLTPGKAMEACNKSFLEDEQDVSIKISDINVVHGSGGNRRISRLHNVEVCQKQQPTSGDPLKDPEKEQNSILKAVENCDLDTAVPDNVSAKLPEISSNAVEKNFPVSLVTPEKAMEDCNKSFLEDEQDMSIKMNDINVVHDSGGNRRSSRLLNVKVCHKLQPSSGDPLKHPEKEQSTLKAMGNCNLDTAVPDNVSGKLPEISSDAGEQSFPTLVSPDKTTGDCNKAFLENEHDMSIKTGEVNVVHGCAANRRSARLHNVKLYQKKQPAIESPATLPDKDQISASAVLEKSDGGPETLSTPIQSQKGVVNTLSVQVTNKYRSRISKTPSAKTEGCYKKKRVSVEREVGRPKRKVVKTASSGKSPQGSDVVQLNKGSKQRLSTVSPVSSSLKKSRSGRLLLPPLEFWRNQIPIFNGDREIIEIQEGSSFISPLRGNSPSFGRF